ncbi:ketol-acid reductoisomerase [Candidatus Woesearchaeota archaeon]|nr:ketol-acid reductoisomerase [Candidatus Woesearchaeota archaeon]
MPKQIKDAQGKVVGELLQEADVKSNMKGKMVAVIGYASQGRGQSLCYRDSGITTILGLRKDGPSWKKAQDDGWTPNKTLFSVPDAVKKADVVVILIADTAQPEVYQKDITPYLKAGKTLMFSHGFNVHFKGVVPPKNVDVIMIAPKGPGFIVREQYEAGFGVPALVAVHQDYSGKAWDTVLAMAKALGATRPGVLKTTFKEEVESDLFGEQVDLCGGVTKMVEHAYNTLVEAGYSPVVAYWEVHHELYGLIAPLAYKLGNVGMLNHVSLTARKGALLSGKRVMDKHVKDNMKACLKDIQSGKFAKEWMDEYKKYGFTKLQAELDDFSKEPVEFVGKQVRQIMWPNEKAH